MTCWNHDDLSRELVAYRDCLGVRGLKPKSIESHWRYAERSIRWLYGDYHARGVEPRNHPLPKTRCLTLVDLRLEREAYVKYLITARLSPGGILTYRRGADYFLDFLEFGCPDG